jgi:hypothetical protein
METTTAAATSAPTDTSEEKIVRYMTMLESTMLQNERNLRRFQLFNKQMANLVADGCTPADAREKTSEARQACADADKKRLEEGGNSIEVMRDIVRDLFREMAVADESEFEVLAGWTDEVMEKVETEADAKMVDELIAGGMEPEAAKQKIDTERESVTKRVAHEKIELVSTYTRAGQTPEEAEVSAIQYQRYQRSVAHESHKRNELLKLHGATPEDDLDMFNPMITIAELKQYRRQVAMAKRVESTSGEPNSQ